LQEVEKLETMVKKKKNKFLEIALFACFLCYFFENEREELY